MRALIVFSCLALAAVVQAEPEIRPLLRGDAPQVQCCGSTMYFQQEFTALQEAKVKDGKIIPEKGQLVHFKGYIKPSKEVLAKRHADAFARHGWRMYYVMKTSTPPAQFDCVQMGWVPPIRDQGPCGSCYLVSAADAQTCCFIKAGYQKADDSFNIAAQYGMDCQNFGGCNGGDEAEVIAYMKAKGFPAERYLDGNGKSVSDYPGYEARNNQCRLKAGAKLWQIADWGYVGSNQGQSSTVAEIKAALMQFGVLSVALDASSFNNYSGGVITNLGNNIDHAITIVGWDDSKSALKLRNQWSEQFGEKGYLWVAYSAVPQLTEVIWLTAAALPPPPVPPVPPPPIPPTPPGPGPGPAGAITSITVSYADGTSQTVDAVPAGARKALSDLEKLLNPMNSKGNGAVVNPSDKTLQDSVERLLKVMERQNARIETLEKAIGATKK